MPRNFPNLQTRLDAEFAPKGGFQTLVQCIYQTEGKPKGKREAMIAAAFDVAPRTAQRWLERYYQEQANAIT